MTRRRCVSLPNGGYLCGSFTRADVEALSDPNEQLDLDEMQDAFDEIERFGTPNLAGGGS